MTVQPIRLFGDPVLRTPADPVTDFAGYLPYVVLAEVLTDGDASRLVERASGGAAPHA